MTFRSLARFGLLVAALSAAPAEGKEDSAHGQPKNWAVYSSLSFPDVEVGVSFSPKGHQTRGMYGSLTIRRETDIPSDANPNLGFGLGFEVPFRHFSLGARGSFFMVSADGRDVDHDGTSEISGVRGGYAVGQVYAAVPLSNTIDLIVGASKLSGAYNFESEPGSKLDETQGLIGARLHF